MPPTQTTSLMILLAAASGLAAAEPEKKESTDKDLLKGPRVVDSSEPAQRDAGDAMSEEGMSRDAMKENGGEEADKAERTIPISFREYTVAIRQLARPQTETRLGLTQAQQEQVRDIIADHREMMREFLEEHRDQIQRLRQAISERAGQGKQRDGEGKGPLSEADRDEGDGADKGGADRAQHAQRKLRMLIDRAEPAKRSLERIRGVLSEDQRQVVEHRVKQMRQRLEQRRENAGEGRERGARRAPARRVPAVRPVDADKVEHDGPRRKRDRTRGKPQED